MAEGDTKLLEVLLPPTRHKSELGLIRKSGMQREKLDEATLRVEEFILGQISTNDEDAKGGSETEDEEGSHNETGADEMSEGKGHRRSTHPRSRTSRNTAKGEIPRTSGGDNDKIKKQQQQRIIQCIPTVTKRAPRRTSAHGRSTSRKKKGDEPPRKTSTINFTIPKSAQNPDEIQHLKTQRMVQKLVKYMKKSWKVKVGMKPAEREMVYRTTKQVYTKKPENWEEIQLEREEFANRTGFFSGLDGPYKSLIDLELDTPMLVLNNLPRDLKISSERWVRMEAEKEEKKRRRDAFPPRPPPPMIKRPVRGPLLKDPGGYKALNDFINAAEKFQTTGRSPKDFPQTLAEFKLDNIEDKNEQNGGFGPVSDRFKQRFCSASGQRPERRSREGKEGFLGLLAEEIREDKCVRFDSW